MAINSSNLWPWILFHLLILILLLLDLGVFNRRSHEIKVAEALRWSGIYISIGLLFNVGIYFLQGKDLALKFLSGYLIENSLSIDNLFVFLSIFTVFKVPAKYQHRILFWGIIGAIIMRGIFIIAGITLTKSFSFIIYIFAAFLIFTGIKFLKKTSTEHQTNTNNMSGSSSDRSKDEKVDGETSSWQGPLKLVKRFLPFTDSYHEGKFLVVISEREGEKKKLMGTPLLLVLLIIEIVDLLFAIDSIPAVIAITTDPFIVYTSNILAIIGLRSLYFALASIMPLFYYLQYGLACILIFIGAKIFIDHFYELPSFLSPLVVVTFISASIIISIMKSKSSK